MDHRILPVFASIARNRPLLLPENTRPPAVARVPPFNGVVSLMPHTFSCLTGSQAINSPRCPPGPGFGGNSLPRYSAPRLYWISADVMSMHTLFVGM